MTPHQISTLMLVIACGYSGFLLYRGLTNNDNISIALAATLAVTAMTFGSRLQ